MASTTSRLLTGARFLEATLNSLAMTNVASVLNAKKHKKTAKEILDEEKEETGEEEEEREEEH